MTTAGTTAWWQTLRVQQKVWAVLIVLLIPLSLALGLHLYLVNLLLNAQHDRHAQLRTLEQVHILRRLVVDIEDAFRGYVLTQQEQFLLPMHEAEAKLDRQTSVILALKTDRFEGAEGLASFVPRVMELLDSKRSLIQQMKTGKRDVILSYIRSGQGLLLSDALRHDLRVIEDRLDAEVRQLEDRIAGLSRWTFTGLWVAMGGVIVLGLISARLLARSITDPIARLQAAVAKFGLQVDPGPIQKVISLSTGQGDELMMLAQSSHEMAIRIARQIQELETLESIGREINTIGPDGVEGVLRRITDRAVELADADACLVLLRNEPMGCWIVEAASGEWNDRLKKSIMLWEEFPISVQAYETRQPAIGERFRSDARPEVVRRNLIGESMLAIPLLAQGEPFGVLALLSDEPRTTGDWNERLAVGMAQQAAVALSNARLYETARQQQRGLVGRLRHLEHLAETLAHDLKGPSERVSSLAGILLREYQSRLDQQAVKWVSLLEVNSREMVDRVEGILAVARVGSTPTSVTAVDPKIVIDDVLKAQAGEVQRLQATVQVEDTFPFVACHEAYLRQVFDNLLSNALKYARPGSRPHVTIASSVQDHLVCFSVKDRGIGIPPEQRARVFQPFVRLRQSGAVGSGIGLAIVSRIVELYGGRVWIDETPSQETNVLFTMPRFEDGGISRTTAGECVPTTDDQTEGRPRE